MYDVFVSYHGREADFATEIAVHLRGLGLRVWFDQWELRPGKNWLPQLDGALATSNAIAVLIGAAGPGPWHRVEVGSALLRFAETGKPVIPVLLPNTDSHDIPQSMEHHTPIRYKSGGLSVDALDYLVWALTGKHPTVSIDEFGDEFTLHVPTIPHRNPQVRLLTLPNPAPGALLYISWATFGKGIERIVGQIKSFGGRLDVDACFGINEAGLVMATFLASAQFQRSPVGYLKCVKSRDEVSFSPDSLYPRLAAKPTIVVCDFEVKYADVVGTVTAKLRDEYAEPDIYFAVFGAMTESPGLEISSFDELCGAEIIRSAGFLSIFIAATMHPPGIEPPLELR